jgi:hypothetical protein
MPPKNQNPLVVSWEDEDEEDDDIIPHEELGLDLELELEPGIQEEIATGLEINGMIQEMLLIIELQSVEEFRLAKAIEKEEERLSKNQFKMSGKSAYEKNADTCREHLESYRLSLDILKQQLENIPLYAEILRFSKDHDLTINEALIIKRKEFEQVQIENEKKFFIYRLKILISSIQNLNLGESYRYINNPEERERRLKSEKTREIGIFIDLVKKLYETYKGENTTIIHQYYIEYLKDIVKENAKHEDTVTELCDIIDATLHSFDLHDSNFSQYLEIPAYIIFCSYNRYNDQGVLINSNDNLMEMWNELTVEEKEEWVSLARDNM